MKYYLIVGKRLVGVIDEASPGTIALPLIRTGEAMSLINEEHVQALMTNLELSASGALTALGLIDERGTIVQAVFVAPQMTGIATRIDGSFYKLIDIGEYSLWQVNVPITNLLEIHAELWAMSPTQTLGALAVVATFGTSFGTTSVRTATGMTSAQALARRNRVADYLDSLGHDTTALRAATNENTQMKAIVEALGYTTTQMWEAMVE